MGTLRLAERVRRAKLRLPRLEEIFGNVTTAPSYLISTRSLACLRYVSWHLSAMTGAGPVTFTIRGMARRYHI